MRKKKKKDHKAKMAGFDLDSVFMPLQELRRHVMANTWKHAYV